MQSKGRTRTASRTATMEVCLAAVMLSCVSAVKTTTSVIQPYANISCEVDMDEIKQSAFVTCHFAIDIRTEQWAFNLHRIEQKTNIEELSYACHWPSLPCTGEPGFGLPDDQNIANTVRFTIPASALGSIFFCQLSPEDIGITSIPCEFRNKTDSPIETSTIRNCDECNPQDSQQDQSHISLLIGVLAAIVAALVVVSLILAVFIVRCFFIRRKFNRFKAVHLASDFEEELLVGNNYCAICRSSIRHPKTLSCGDTFCTKCIDPWLKHQGTCPNCKYIERHIIGQQPDNGTMAIIYSGKTLPGYETENAGSYIIRYHFDEGVQKKRYKHPHPGKKYQQLDRKAYLPDTKEGRKVLMLLKIAFDRRLIFTLAHSWTRYTDNEQIVWNGIYHKTEISGGPTAYGYPDDGYLNTVQEQLRNSFGITEVNLPNIHKRFIEDPVEFHGNTGEDFSHKFPPQRLES